jgi:hypothetical protein
VVDDTGNGDRTASAMQHKGYPRATTDVVDA